MKKKKQEDDSQTLFEARLEIEKRLYRIEDIRWVKNYLDEYEKCQKHLSEIAKIREMIKEDKGVNMICKMYRWVAHSDDECFNDQSESNFISEEECYKDMRRHALLKMEWNTEFSEDFGGDWDSVYYEVRFSKRKITHRSYSGVYTYEIEEVE